MLKVYPRSAKWNSKSLFPLLPRCLIFALGVAFCVQPLAGQTKVAYFAGGCFWCTQEIFQQTPGVNSVISGYMNSAETDRKSTRLNSSHVAISYAVFCL